MLEQSLHKLPPQDASLALLAFLRDELPAGGASAEQRFVSLFPPLMERICGRLIQVSDNAAAVGSDAARLQKKPTYQHSPDAWLSLPAPLNPSTDPLVRLLRAPRCLPLDHNGTSRSPSVNNANNNNGAALAPSLLDAISAESKRVLFDYPLNALDDALIGCWRGYIQRCSQTAAIGMGSAYKPGTRYAQKPMQQKQQAGALPKGKEQTIQLLELLPDQPALRQTALQLQSPSATKNTLHHSPFGTSFGGSPISKSPSLRFGTNTPSSSLLFSPTSGTLGGTNGGSPSNNLEIQEPKIQLTMLQYYFMLYLRFPFLENKQHVSSSQIYGRSAVNRTASSGNSASIYGYLFNGYLSYYLPSSSTTTTGNNSGVHPNSLLFLHLIIEFWLCHNVIPTTEMSLRLLRVDTVTLRDCIDISRVVNTKKFQTLPLKVQNGILATAKHLLGDLSLREAVKRTSAMIQVRQKEEREGNVPSTPARGDTPQKVDNTPNTASTSSSSNQEKVWCLPPAMSTIQQSLLNYIRVGLASGSIHNKDSSFHRALEVWLLWIEPWNFTVKKRMVPSNITSTAGTPRDFVRLAANAAAQHKNIEYYSHYTRPKPTSRSGYHPQWEAYVVSNLYFYVLPLSIFLRRARELEFSNAAEFPKSLTLVQRVLRCYPRPIVNVLNGVLHSRADGITSGIVSRHLELLGPYAPPEDWKLSSCQVDAMNLLEEMFGQYQKIVGNMNFLDRWEARVDALFSGSMQREDGALQIVLGQLKCLVGLPLEYSVATEVVPEQNGWLSRFFGKASAIGMQIDTVGPDRSSDGLLTDLGRQQLAAGKRKCSPFDVHYIGDPMLAPYQSHEVPALVDLAIFISNYVNDKLGLVPLSTLVKNGDGQDEDDMLTKNIREMERYKKIVFRVNLRFLADYRNVLAISFAVWFMRKLS